MAGFHILQDMGKIGVQYPINSLVTTRSFIRKDPSTVKGILMAYSEGVQRLFKDKTFSKQVFSKYMRVNDPEALDSSYDYAKNFVERIPTPPYKGLATLIGQLGETNPKVKSHKPEEFIDSSFFTELERNRFFESIAQ